MESIELKKDENFKKLIELIDVNVNEFNDSFIKILRKGQVLKEELNSYAGFKIFDYYRECSIKCGLLFESYLNTKNKIEYFNSDTLELFKNLYIWSTEGDCEYCGSTFVDDEIGKEICTNCGHIRNKLTE